MPVYTHTFEIEAANIGKVEGKMSFNGDERHKQPPKIKITEPVNCSLDEFKEIGALLREIYNLYKIAGIIEKIELVKKP